jgi:hypothetical protein
MGEKSKKSRKDKPIKTRACEQGSAIRSPKPIFETVAQKI